MLNLRIHPNVLKEQIIHGLGPKDTVLDGANLMVRHDISAIVIFGDDGKLVVPGHPGTIPNAPRDCIITS